DIVELVLLQSCNQVRQCASGAVPLDAKSFLHLSDREFHCRNRLGCVTAQRSLDKTHIAVRDPCSILDTDGSCQSSEDGGATQIDELLDASRIGGHDVGCPE